MSSDPNEDFLPFSRPSISQASIDEVVACLKSGWITTGPRVKQFEEDLKTYLGAPHVLALSSATAGLHLVLVALSLKPGDKVITTPMTFAATLNTIRKSIIESIVASGETSTFITALAYSFAASPAEVEVEHMARRAGESKYRLYDLVRLNFDLMTGFSVVPLQVFTLFGIVVSVFSLLFVVFLFIRRIVVGPEAEGLFTLFAILYFFVGIGIMGLGIIGEYIGRIYKEVRRRPRFVIREIYEKTND